MTPPRLGPITLASLGTVSIDGPDDVALGSPAIVIENNKIRITPAPPSTRSRKAETATIHNSLYDAERCRRDGLGGSRRSS
jgi:hypothetical protein